MKKFLTKILKKWYIIFESIKKGGKIIENYVDKVNKVNADLSLISREIKVIIQDLSYEERENLDIQRLIYLEEQIDFIRFSGVFNN